MTTYRALIFVIHVIFVICEHLGKGRSRALAALRFRKGFRNRFILRGKCQQRCTSMMGRGLGLYYELP